MPEHKDSDKAYQEFLDSIPRIAVAYRCHRMMLDYWLANGEEKKDDHVKF